jgi:hypothetical protein
MALRPIRSRGAKGPGVARRRRNTNKGPVAKRARKLMKKTRGK